MKNDLRILHNVEAQNASGAKSIKQLTDRATDTLKLHAARGCRRRKLKGIW